MARENSPRRASHQQSTCVLNGAFFEAQNTRHGRSVFRSLKSSVSFEKGGWRKRGRSAVPFFFFLSPPFFLFPISTYKARSQGQALYTRRVSRALDQRKGGVATRLLGRQCRQPGAKGYRSCHTVCLPSNEKSTHPRLSLACVHARTCTCTTEQKIDTRWITL